MVKYSMEMNEEQTAILLKALELYARIGTGQISDLLWHPAFEAMEPEKHLEMEEALMTVKKLAFPHLKEAGDCMAIRNEQVVSASKDAYDMLQVMKHSLALADKSDKHSVWRYAPRAAGSMPFVKFQVR